MAFDVNHSCLFADVRRPLIVLDSADMDTSVLVNHETNLTSLLRNATRWGAIVLLDEADVFLTARAETKDSTQNNPRISTLMSQIEYRFPF